MPARAALLDALPVPEFGGRRHRGGAVGWLGGAAASPRAAGLARRTSCQPAEVRRHLSLPKPAPSASPPAPAAVRSLAAVLTAAQAGAQRISPEVSGRGAREYDAGRRYVHN